MHGKNFLPENNLGILCGSRNGISQLVEETMTREENRESTPFYVTTFLTTYIPLKVAVDRAQMSVCNSILEF